MPVPRSFRPSRRFRLAAAAVAGALALTACSSVTGGHLAAHSVPDAHLAVKGVADDSFDTFAQNALSDIAAFWKKNFPKVSGGKAFEPLAGGYYSVDGRQVAISGEAKAPATENKCIEEEDDAIVDNAFYCRSDDSIAWDRSSTHLLGVLSKKYGRLLVGLIFAHEFGHAIQERLGTFDDESLKTIYTESQADCAAGAWAASALKDQAPHFTDTTSASLDRALEGYLNARDSTPDSPQEISHGNGFDRLSAVADGLDHGVTYCYSKGYFASRHFTERGYNDQTDAEDQGNLPLSQTIDTSSSNPLTTDLNRFWTAAAKLSSSGKSFTPVSITSAGHPACAASGVRFGYCPSTNRVYFESAFARSAYYSLPAVGANRTTGDIELSVNQPADFAIGELFSIGWGLAVRHQLFGRSLTDGDALTSAVCYSGAYAKDVNVVATRNDQFTLSPADLDEAVSAILDQVPKSTAFGARGTTGLQRIQAFVKGYSGGLTVC